MIEMELSDDLMAIMTEFSGTEVPEDAKSVKPKFDDKGTLHVMCRDEDGKLLKDIGLKGKVYEKSYNDSLKDDLAQAQLNTKAQSRFVNIMLGIIGVSLALLCAMTIVVIQSLR